MLLCIGYNYNVYIITSSGFKKYSMANCSGSYQCDPKLAIPDIFLDMETNPSCQAIGSEFYLTRCFEIGGNRATQSNPELFIFCFDW